MPTDDHAAGPDTDDASGPCALGLLMGTLALMTAHAVPEPAARADAATLRRLVGRKIVSNLYFLQHHPDAPPPLRQVAARLHARWLPLAPPDGDGGKGLSTPPAGNSLH